MSSPHASSQCHDVPANDDLKRRVEGFLLSRNYPALRGLCITVQGGQVVISGSVSTFYEKQLASNCAQRVAGVLEVINEIIVPVQIPLKRK